MLGAITGDIIGSVYEFDSLKPEYGFPLLTEESFCTDDTVLTVALAHSILSGTVGGFDTPPRALRYDCFAITQFPREVRIP